MAQVLLIYKKIYFTSTQEIQIYAVHLQQYETLCFLYLLISIKPKLITHKLNFYFNTLTRLRC